jgi:hypothetical protein
VINPCNPTGEYLNVQELKEYIKEQTEVRRILDELELKEYIREQTEVRKILLSNDLKLKEYIKEQTEVRSNPTGEYGLNVQE